MTAVTGHRTCFLLSTLFVFIILAASCKGNMERGVFPKMKDTYDDVRVRDNFFFIKSFGLNQRSLVIEDKLYWNLHSDKDAYFFLSGFIRAFNDSVMFLPYDYLRSFRQNKEKKLFDFSAGKGESWSIQYNDMSNYIMGDSIVFTGKETINNKAIFKFMFHPFTHRGKKRKYYIDRPLEVYVSKENGIVSIRESLSNRTKIADWLVLTLYPNQKFVNRYPDLLKI
jgi:hypothetical protein